MFSTRILLILIPLLPLVAAIATAALGPRVLRQRSDLPTIIALLGSFLCSLMLFVDIGGKSFARPQETPSNQVLTATVGYEEVHTLWTWANVLQAYPESAKPFPVAALAETESDMDSNADALARVPIAGGNRAWPGDFRIDVVLRADPLTAIMLVMVTFISSLVAIYARGYMKGDSGYWRFFAYVSLFVFSMTMLVSVSNFLLLFVFWEAVGVCSYLLIGFWYEKPSAAAAGKKAFLVNRVGDFGFALAIFLIWTTYGTLNFHDSPDGIAGVLGQSRLAADAFVGGGIGLAICLLLLLGACGKSAQFPLHVWLPDAMEGPTPVSALIHAATMVTAGVYMITRCTPLFLVSPTAQVTVASIGGFTALMAGLIALTQYDLKRVLAYSTVSQLGYMFLGLGTGTMAGITAGMFHLFTHAFFKALLFLGSGSVMHAMGGVIDMRRFRGLRKLMPITHATFAVGCLALAGVFPFSGFWSKDAIVASVHDQGIAMQTELDRRMAVAGPQAGDLPQAEDNLISASAVYELRDQIRIEMMAGASREEVQGARESSDGAHADHGGVTTTHLAKFSDGELRCAAQVYPWLYVLGLGTALLTAIYTFRAFFMTFYGDEKVPPEAGDHAHESPLSMWGPLVVLAAFAFAIGFLLETTHVFAKFLARTPSLATPAAANTLPAGVFHLDIAIVSSIMAVLGIAIAAFLYLGNQSEAAAIKRALDSPALGRPYRWSFGKFFFDEIYQWTIVKPLEGLAALSYLADRWVIDGLVNACGMLPKMLGGWIRGIHKGFVPFYGFAMVIGMLLLFAAGALWGGN